MARIVIIGAGFAGHTAAVYLGKRLGKKHDITVVNRFSFFLYLPSLIWVGVDRMAPEKVRFPLKPIYDRINVGFVKGIATSVHPDENYVIVRKSRGFGTLRLDYDYLLIATGPHLDFDATKGLGPDHGNSHSICTLDHTIHCRNRYLECRERMARGDRVRILVGTGHGTSTCQGAALEYLLNIHSDLVRRGLRDKARLTWISNEPEPGDFGVGGIRFQKGPVPSSAVAMDKIFKTCDIRALFRKGVREVDEKAAFWEDYDGSFGETGYDFSVLIPKFAGAELKFINRTGQDLSERLLTPGNFIRVDGVYGLEYNSLQYTPEAWPATYQNPEYRNIFAAGVAFAPPGPISVPCTTPNGTRMGASPPRTGMAAGIIGRLTALNIISLVNAGELAFQERMTEMYGACIASADPSLWSGFAVSMLLYPVVPNHIRYPDTHGRDPFITRMEGGLSGAWIKRIIHTTMYYKAQAFPGWQFIPE